MFTAKDGRILADYKYLNWLDDRHPPPIARRGIYILYKGTTPVYVGRGISKWGIYSRLKAHARNWLAHAWDNASWYVFDEHESVATIEAVEALLVATVPSLLNGAQPGRQLGIKCFPNGAKNEASNTLWKQVASDDSRT
jgi:hypothetical protein